MGILHRLFGGQNARDWSGWRLEATMQVELVVDLDGTLGELAPAKQTVLCDAIGDAAYAACEADDSTVEVDSLSAADAAELIETLTAAGFRIAAKPGERYHAYRESQGTLTYIDDVSRSEMNRIAAEMLRAGVPVVRKPASASDAKLPHDVARAWRIHTPLGRDHVS